MLSTILTMVIAAFVAEAFFYTFSMAIDTILMCFCYDVHANGVADHNKALRKVRRCGAVVSLWRSCSLSVAFSLTLSRSRSRSLGLSRSLADAPPPPL